MNRDIFYDRIKEKLNEYFIQEEYVFVKSQYGWVKRLKDKTLLITMLYYKTGDESSAMFTFTVRIREIQKLVCPYCSMNNPNSYKDSSTILIPLTTFIKYPDRAFRFYTLEELDEIIKNYYKPFVVEQLSAFDSYFAKTNNILDALMNPENRYSNVIGGNVYNNRLIILAIYKLLDYPNYDKILNNSRAELEKLKIKWPGSNEVRLYDTYFNEFVKYLSTYEFPSKLRASL